MGENIYYNAEIKAWECYCSLDRDVFQWYNNSLKGLTKMKKYKIIDAHCHIYPDKIAEKASLGTGAFYNVKMAYDGKIDTLFTVAERAGIDRCLIHSVATTAKQVASINSFIAQEVQLGKGRFIGFGALHPDSEDIKGDVESLISLGLCGVKLHPDIQGVAADDPRCLKIYDEIAGKIPLLIHCGDSRYNMSNPEQISRVMDMYPHMTVIAAHFGGYSVWEKAVECYAGRKNVYVDTSSSFWKLSDEQIREYIKAYGVDKVLFGTDYPMWDACDELDRLFSLGLSEREYDMILHENLERLLGL